MDYERNEVFVARCQRDLMGMEIAGAPSDVLLEAKAMLACLIRLDAKRRSVLNKENPEQTDIDILSDLGSSYQTSEKKFVEAVKLDIKRHVGFSFLVGAAKRSRLSAD